MRALVHRLFVGIFGDGAHAGYGKVQSGIFLGIQSAAREPAGYRGERRSLVNGHEANCVDSRLVRMLKWEAAALRTQTE
jgi:hypothetical protein